LGVASASPSVFMWCLTYSVSGLSLYCVFFNCDMLRTTES